MPYYKPFLSLVLCLFMVSLSSCSSDKASVYEKSKALMDTYITITIVAESKEAADNIIENAFDVIEKYGDLINFFSERANCRLSTGAREYRKLRYLLKHLTP